MDNKITLSNNPDTQLTLELVNELTLEGGSGVFSVEEHSAVKALPNTTIPEPLALELENEELTESITPVAEVVGTEGKKVVEEKEKGDLRGRLGRLSLPQRLKCALFGNAFVRAILVRDGSKLVQAAVLKNPRLTPQEVEDFAKSPNTPEQVLRGIAHSPSLMRTYSMKVAIVMNPKTPTDLALKWLRFMNLNELKKIAKSKAIPQVVATMAKKRVIDLEEAR